jgi:hypothetical protein
LLSVAIHELDWHIVSMFGEEADCLLTCLDGLLHKPNGRSFFQEVGASLLSNVVFGSFFLNFQ